MRQPLKKRIIEARELLQANERDMARLLRIGIDTYKALESGGRILPMPAQRAVTKRLDGLLEKCGLAASDHG